jgi:hypothetical protein
MTPQKPQQGDRALKKSLVRPAVEVDCSSWENDAPAVSWTTGRFLKPSLVRAAVEVDCSGWPEGPAVSLELTLHPAPSVDAVQLAFGMFDVLNAVNRLDCALGGTGFSKVAGQQCNGAVTITLAPRQQAGAADRIGRICDQVNRASSTTELPLPASVKTLQARVA